MDQGDINFAAQSAPQSTFLLSWVAYVRPIVLFLVLVIIGLIVSQSANNAIIILIGYAVIFVAILKMIYDVMWLKRVRFYYNQDGVWIYSGILPWNKGVSGVKWRDIDEATYYTGFISWLTKSYRIRVGHRFTKSSEMFLSHVKRGNLAAAAINETLMREFRDPE